MKLVKLSCDCYINPHEVQHLTVNQSSNHITVRMRDGIGHSVGADYGKSIYTTMDRLTAEIDEALV